jgi:hypothetical protein
MSVVVNNALAIHAAKLLFGTDSYQSWIVDLYVNIYSPTPVDTLAQYVLCTLPGYSAFGLNGGQWAGGIVSPGVAQFTYPLITFNFDAYGTPQQTVFGYVVSMSGLVLYAELFPAPFPVPPAGGQLPLILTWTDEQCAT